MIITMIDFAWCNLKKFDFEMQKYSSTINNIDYRDSKWWSYFNPGPTINRQRFILLIRNKRWVSKHNANNKNALHQFGQLNVKCINDRYVLRRCECGTNNEIMTFLFHQMETLGRGDVTLQILSLIILETVFFVSISYFVHSFLFNLIPSNNFTNSLTL